MIMIMIIICKLSVIPSRQPGLTHTIRKQAEKFKASAPGERKLRTAWMCLKWIWDDDEQRFHWTSSRIRVHTPAAGRRCEGKKGLHDAHAPFFFPFWISSSLIYYLMSSNVRCFIMKAFMAVRSHYSETYVLDQRYWRDPDFTLETILLDLSTKNDFFFLKRSKATSQALTDADADPGMCVFEGGPFEHSMWPDL